VFTFCNFEKDPATANFEQTFTPKMQNSDDLQSDKPSRAKSHYFSSTKKMVAVKGKQSKKEESSFKLDLEKEYAAVLGFERPQILEE
jgi:hypothetical protein